MNPASLIPLAEPIPIHWAWFDLLLVTTFTAHILFMNALVGSAAIGLVHAMRGDSGLAREVGKKAPPLLALTINLGVAPLLFLQVNYGQFDYVSSVLMGGWWLAVIAALMLAYYGFYAYKFGHDALSPGRRTALLAVSLVGTLYVALMLTTNMTLMLRPEFWPQYFEKTGAAVLNFGDPTLYPRFLHFMVGAAAVGGLFVALLGRWGKNDAFVEVGMRWLNRATLVNLGIGLWFLVSLPPDILLAFLGGSLPATLTLVAGLGCAGMLLAAGFRKQPIQATVWAVLTVFFMSLTRHWLRTLFLAPWFNIKDTPVTGQYSPVLLFAVFLVAGVAAMAYMLKLYFKSREGRA
ncbi:hypothetical protein GKC30_14740 [Pseudodesulfovibrio sp. F-1]|uniref:Polysulphide reductase NrfD n=1 Tax=Pseudodesulfovibrio alkaliphilus TaxID=2661613 RepID=A0A7K1KS55_9BACT|nr:hypothetical protein [Pseudodesulfovibrio alkaliphilus]MUM78888.1 hypothetical protein [Pseudodesulfovibrio alkaliphilus]